MILGLFILTILMFIYLPIEIWQCILNLLNFKNKIIMRMACKLFYDKLEIWDFCNIHYRYRNTLTNTILLAYPFIRYLNATYNPKITNVNHLTNLKILWACGTSGIDDYGIKNLNLIELYAYNNPKITNANHLTNLKVLWAYGNSGIDDNGIKNLDLIELYAFNNPKITKKIDLIIQ